jgi:hypothetical protein
MLQEWGLKPGASLRGTQIGFKKNLSLVIGNIKTWNVPFGGFGGPLKYYFGKFFILNNVLNSSDDFNDLSIYIEYWQNFF